jgi:GWxTD domain-containing protein
VRSLETRWAELLRLGVGALITAALLAPAGARSDQASADHATSVGDLRFHAAVTPFRHGEREARADFSIRVPYRQIRFLPDNDRLSAKLRITVEMWNSAGKRTGYLQREAILQSTDVAAARDSLLGEIYTVGLAAPAGVYTYRVRVEDMNSDRQGLVYKMKDQKRQGEVNGTVDMGPWLFKNPALSGIEFAWEIRDRIEGSPFTRGPYDVMPQPSAYYGHFQEAVSVYYELYDDPPPPGGAIRLIEAHIVDASGDTVFTSVDSLRITEGTGWPHAMSVDTSELAGGHYRLVLRVRDDDRGVAAETRGAFDVLWSLDSWRPDAVDLYEVTASTLMPSDSVLVFRALSMGDKERWVERLWRGLDPTPDTGDNELRDEFLRRVNYANAHYSIFERGMFSDRGRVYIRYGEPDDVKIERIPVGGKTLGYALGDKIPLSSKREITDTTGGTADDRAYEIWTYDMKGKELVPRFGMNEVASGLKFVFVDQQGYGEYTLDYSSTTGIH